MYFTITNENRQGIQYHDGLFILTEEFKYDSSSGDFYFTNATNIFNFIENGVYLWEVFLPTDNKDFKMLKISSHEGDKWRSNMIILGKRYDLNKVDTFKFLVEVGANIHTKIDYLLRWSAKNGERIGTFRSFLNLPFGDKVIWI